jgi:hypothetical protein
MLPTPMSRVPASSLRSAPACPAGACRGFAAALVLLLLGAPAALAQPVFDQDRIDLTGQQNLTLGAGARAYGMGGAFLARADDATAASWNPAGLSYLRTPEVSLVGTHNSFRQTGKDFEIDTFEGGSFDFAAFTWPLAFKEIRGSIQLSYQRAIGFDGKRSLDAGGGRRGDGTSDGGFDVLAFGTGFRPTRSLRVGFTVNRWLNGYDQTLVRQIPENLRPLREFETSFRIQGWSVNLGVIWSPVENVNIGGVFKTPFTADVTLSKRRKDTWASDSALEGETFNAASSDEVRIEFPASVGFGISWRVRDTLTVSADFTQSRWSQAFIQEYFTLPFTPRREDPTRPPNPPTPNVFDELPYPTLVSEQVDARQIRAGVEWVVISSPRVKVPLRAGYFNDRQITAYPDGRVPRYHGVTFGTGLILGPLLLDVAYLLEFGSDTVNVTVPSESEDEDTIIPVEFSLRTQRVFASLIYRFGRRP